ncbi:MAG TPA: VOC family protein [bacterium]
MNPLFFVLAGFAYFLSPGSTSVFTKSQEGVEVITIDKITIAVGNMEQMLKFYSQVFGVEFRPLAFAGETLQSVKIGNMELLFCSKSLAKVDADHNTIQLRFVVEDVQKAFAAGLANGGKQINAVQMSEGRLHGSLRDPDNNSLEFIQSN